MKKTHFNPFRVLVILLLTIFAIFFCLPFFWMLATSLRSPLVSFRLPPAIIPTAFDISNYKLLFEKVRYLAFFQNSVYVSVMTTVFQVLVCTMAAYAFSRLNFPGKNMIFILFLTAMMIPAQVTTIPRFIFMSKLRLINTHMALILPALYSALGIFLLRQHMLTIPKSYDEAAYMDGAGKIWTFAMIIVPMSKPSIVVIAVMTFINTWNDFFNPLIYINSRAKMTIPLGITQITGSFNSGNQGAVIAAIMLSLIPPLLFYILGQRWLMKGISIGGIKG
ncbi:MAG: carbohydrate ABC transporter permease [Spirochaetaceae bacterium]|jgi:multiple sugar transport system permease protein|nr:carbohydrate ABC transporter permease [Spirochaetaceae bacterium]